MPLLIDPTYLRYVVDGLGSQSIHKDNIPALPEGLIGIYEEALPLEHNVQARERFLSFFATWALLKKEVSVSLISELLNWSDQDVIDCLSVYTKWFNSPTSGSYILYHERLRVYLFEKISSQNLQLSNQRIISLCQTALELRKGDEWEIYALEHLSSHLLIPAMQNEKDGEEYKKLVNNTSFWNRQIEVSKGYDWTKKMLNQSMGWAAKQSTDELIECVLNKVDLHNLEQNDAPRIVELVAQNDVDTALQRIEAFGGNDKEGLQQKFMLYMLCLMELTLLDSKDKPFRKTAIEKLLNYLDENTPVDHSLLNWNDFFPSYLMFQIACELADLELNYIFLYEFTEIWQTEWIKSKAPFGNHQFDVLIKCTLQLTDDWEKRKAISVISTELIKQGYDEESLKLVSEIEDSSNMYRVIKDITLGLSREKLINQSLILAHKIDDQYWKSLALKEISVELFNQNQVEYADKILKNSFQYVPYITNECNKYEIISLIAAELVRQGYVLEAFTYVKDIYFEYYKNIALELIAIELAKQGRIDESLSCAASLTDESGINNIHRAVVIELSKLGKIEEAITLSNSIKYESYDLSPLIAAVSELAKLGRMDEALICKSAICDNLDQSRAFSGITFALAEQGKFEESLKYVNEIVNETVKSEALRDIATEMAKQGKIVDSIKCAHVIKYDSYEVSPFYEIAIQFARQGLVEESLYCLRELNSGYDDKNALLFKIISEFIILGKIEESLLFIYEFLSTSSGIRLMQDKNKIMRHIATELAFHKKINAAILCANAIIYDSHENSLFLEISILLARQGRIEETFSYVNEMDIGRDKCEALLAIASELFKQGKIDESASTIQEALIITRAIKNKFDIAESLLSIASKLAEQGKIVESMFIMEESLNSAVEINNDHGYQSYAMRDIATEFAKKGWSQKSLSCANEMYNDSTKIETYQQIALEFAKHGKIEESIKCVKNLVSESDISIAFREISVEFAKQGMIEESFAIIKEISNESQIAIALTEIVIALAKKGEIEESVAYAFKIVDDKEKSNALNQIVSLLAGKEKIDKALFILEKSINCAEKISEESDKDCAFYEISSILAKYGKFKEAFSLSYRICDDSYKDLALRDIAFESAKQGNWQLAENTLFKISIGEDRHRYWLYMAREIIHKVGIQKAFQYSSSLQNEEAQLFYLRSWAKSLTVDNLSNELAHNAIQALMNDSVSLEHFLQVYAQHELFFGNPSQEKIDRLNKTLNLQWALDIIVQFPKE